MVVVAAVVSSPPQVRLQLGEVKADSVAQGIRAACFCIHLDTAGLALWWLGCVV